MALHGLYVPQNASWVAELRSELLSFPAGKHDDQVDGLGLTGQLLDTISVGNKPAPTAALKSDTGRAIRALPAPSSNSTSLVEHSAGGPPLLLADDDQITGFHAIGTRRYFAPSFST